MFPKYWLGPCLCANLVTGAALERVPWVPVNLSIYQISCKMPMKGTKTEGSSSHLKSAQEPDTKIHEKTKILKKSQRTRDCCRKFATHKFLI